MSHWYHAEDTTMISVRRDLHSPALILQKEGVLFNRRRLVVVAIHAAAVATPYRSR